MGGAEDGEDTARAVSVPARMSSGATASHAASMQIISAGRAGLSTFERLVQAYRARATVSFDTDGAFDLCRHGGSPKRFNCDSLRGWWHKALRRNRQPITGMLTKLGVTNVGIDAVGQRNASYRGTRCPGLGNDLAL